MISNVGQPETGQDSKLIHEKNLSLLADFKTILKNRGLGQDLVDQHETNVDFYINHYLTYNQLRSAVDGAACELVSDFLGNFFVHKAMWTDVNEQKASIESILLFYDWLLDINQVDLGSVQALRNTIENEKDSWFAAMERNTEESLESWQGESEIEFFDELPLNESDEEDNEVDEDFLSELDALTIPTIDEEGSEDAVELESLDDSENNPGKG